MSAFKPLLSMWDSSDNEIKNGIITFKQTQRGSFSEPVTITVWNNRITTKMLDDKMINSILVSWPDALNVTASASSIDGANDYMFLTAPYFVHASVQNKETSEWSNYVPVNTDTVLFEILKGTAYSAKKTNSQANNYRNARFKVLVPSTVAPGSVIGFKLKLNSSVGSTDDPSEEAISAGFDNYEKMTLKV